MSKKSLVQVARELNGKKVRDLEAKSGSLVLTFADGTQLWVVGLNPVAVEYGPDEAETPEPAVAVKPK